MLHDEKHENFFALGNIRVNKNNFLCMNKQRAKVELSTESVVHKAELHLIQSQIHTSSKYGVAQRRPINPSKATCF